VASGYVWVMGIAAIAGDNPFRPNQGVLLRFTPQTHALAGMFIVDTSGSSGLGFAASATSMWIAGGISNQVLKVPITALLGSDLPDRLEESDKERLPVGSGPLAVTVDAEDVWVLIANRDIWHLRATNGRTIGTVDLGDGAGFPRGIAVGEGSAWAITT
jgi:hypothetical protein